jgi:hypothetical protein
MDQIPIRQELGLESMTIDDDGVVTGFSMYHKINGKVAHIEQRMNENDEVESYTNGVKEQ